MTDAFIVDGIRSPIGRINGILADIRPDDLAAYVLKGLISRHRGLDWARTDDVVLGCTNQAGEDSRNIARMALLLSGLPEHVPGVTINRLCASGLEAVADAARRIRLGEADIVLAGGVESMSRAPLVTARNDKPFTDNIEVFDSTIGWRFINPKMKKMYGVDSMPETAENLASEYNIGRADQDAFALRSQQRAAKAKARGYFNNEILPVKGITDDEHPRPETTLEALTALKTPFREAGTVTAGNASGLNDGAAVLFLASERSITENHLSPLARVIATVAVGVAPRIMGIGPVPATKKILAGTGLKLSDMDVIEVNEAFAVQVLAVLREFRLKDNASQVNPNGGAIALGHPLGMSGARLVLTAARELAVRRGKYALITMCVGVGQGMSMILERV